MATDLEIESAPAGSAPVPRQAAVLLLLYPGPDGAVYVPFFRRTERVARHRGQIALPGGAREPADTSLLATAQREAWEELGIEPDSYDVVGELPEVCTSIGDFVVTPFVAAAAARPAFKLDPFEVAELIEAPLERLA